MNAFNFTRRYLAATDVSWRHDDIARLHTLRWLIEVFFENWKLLKAGATEPCSKALKGLSVA